MADIKLANLDHPIEAALSQRWSPYSYAERDVATADLASILEAARWAASSYNEQPWRYILARRSDAASFDKLISCLVEANQTWAKNAPVLLVGVVMSNFARNGKPNKAVRHDLGLASGNLCAEATARGLFVHQMIGIDPERVRELYGLPDDAEALTAMTIGHVGDGSDLPDGVGKLDRAPRARRQLSEFVFGNTWNESANLDD